MDLKISGLTADATPKGIDYITSIKSPFGSGSNRKVLISDLFRGIPDGTAALPSISFASDPDTGFYWTTSGELNYASNGVLKSKIDSTGGYKVSNGSTGFTAYNTADQTTNYEKGSIYWSADLFTIATTQAGSGAARRMQFITGGTGAVRTLTYGATSASSPVLNLSTDPTVITAGLWRKNGTFNASSGIQLIDSTEITIAQSGTAGYTAMNVNITESSTGSGEKLLANLQVNSVSKFKVGNAGTMTNTGGRIESVTTITDATYALLTTDRNLLVNYTATGACTITLPTAQVVAGRVIDIKDAGFNATTNNITITCEGAGTKIENSTGDLIISADGDSITLISNGTDWFIK